jgi:MFS family permease
MLEQILTALLPEQLVSLAARRAGIAAILLFPAALVAGFFLLLKSSPPAPVTVTTSNLQAIEIARAFLLREGIPVTSWRATSKYDTSDNLLTFANDKPEHIRIWSVAPPVYATVTFRAPDSKDSVRVSVSVDGRVLGFSWKGSEPPSAAAKLSDEAALRLATAHLPAGVVFGPPIVENTPSKRLYTFRSSSLPDAQLRAEITLQGGRVTSSEVTAEPDEIGGRPRNKVAQTLLSIAGSMFVCVVTLFSIFRYASRTLQQEISHQRSLIVTLLCGGFCVLLGFNAVINSNAGNIPLALILLVFAITGMMGGALVAAAYGSGEGDVREAFPGKLTSLDALLTGRIFSRNTGVSLLFGMACGGWLIFALGIITKPFAIRTPMGLQSMVSPFVRLGWLMPFITYPLMSLCFAAAGLLQPLAFLKRYAMKWRKWHLTALVICAGLVSTLRTHSPSTPEFLVTSTIFVIALLLPFFLLDLLSTLVCVTVVFATVGMASTVAMVPAFAGTSTILHIAAAAGIVVFAIVCVARGKTYREDQVRPLYARHIAERKSLEAEVSAAREAQLRLLPDSVPDFTGLNIAASCVPAETVGGDFYDFFPLGDGRLGVFIAEGNNRGLAAALTIALAKGYLMQCVERFREPVEILTRLEAMLSSIFDKSAGTDFAFAAIDTTAGEIRYARTGSYPKVVVVSARSAMTSGKVASERMVSVKGRRTPISEGRAELGPGDHVVLFTDGIGRRLASGNRKPEDAAAALISKSQGSTADEIRQKFFTAASASLEPDDLTLVVIRMQALAEFEGTAALRVVA